MIKNVSLWSAVARERRQLRDLSPEQLDDLGLSRETSRLESERPFWDMPAERAGDRRRSSTPVIEPFKRFRFK